MKDRLDVGDDSGYAGFAMFMIVLGVPIFLVTVFSMIGVVLAN
ncbi:MAG: hypothetical protein WEB00_05905 [Dehalococcoidia bacterium]